MARVRVIIPLTNEHGVQQGLRVEEYDNIYSTYVEPQGSLVLDDGQEDVPKKIFAVGEWSIMERIDEAD